MIVETETRQGLIYKREDFYVQFRYVQECVYETSPDI